MGFNFNPFEKKENKTLSELQEEDETMSVELSVAQKKAALAKLKANGVDKKQFGSWKEIWAWFKSH